jgi:tetratricopeptide (TPR) repeat protein
VNRFGIVWGAILAAGLAVRVAYVVFQPSFDPTFQSPMLDGEYYLVWARAIAEGQGGFDGVYYLGPLYPFLLALLTGGYDFDFGFLYLLQHALVVSAAAALGLVARRMSGDRAGIAATALVLLYHPALYFASRPLSEPLGIALLAWGLLAAVAAGGEASRGRAALLAGLLGGLAALARPSFLPIPVLWALVLALRRKPRGALLAALGAALAIAPVAGRNLAVSGHLVPVSANAGIVLWLGNAPGAVGVYTPVEGFSGQLAAQQEEAVALASLEEGRKLDAVEADRHFRKKAVAARLEEPLGTFLLFARRLGLTLDNAEHGLDYAPSLDRNPVRFLAPLPFAVLLGLAVLGGIVGRRSPDRLAWWAAAAGCALTPLLFYVSSRHRLPLALLLAVPAGAALSLRGGGIGRRRLAAGAAAGAIAAVLAFALPTGGLVRAQQAGALANLSVVHKAAGNLEAAERTARLALARDPSSEGAAYNLAVVLEQTARAPEAQEIYRRIVRANPANAEAAGNLASLLVRKGAPGEAVPILEEALRHRPGHHACWSNLVVALASTGDLEGARAAATGAAGHGVVLERGLLEAIGYPGGVSGDGDR